MSTESARNAPKAESPSPALQSLALAISVASLVWVIAMTVAEHLPVFKQHPFSPVWTWWPFAAGGGALAIGGGVYWLARIIDRALNAPCACPECLGGEGQ